jgi:hypothetical protein
MVIADKLYIKREKSIKNLEYLFEKKSEFCIGYIGLTIVTQHYITVKCYLNLI